MSQNITVIGPAPDRSLSVGRANDIILNTGVECGHGAQRQAKSPGAKSPQAADWTDQQGNGHAPATRVSKEPAGPRGLAGADGELAHAPGRVEPGREGSSSGVSSAGPHPGRLLDACKFRSCTLEPDGLKGYCRMHWHYLMSDKECDACGDKITHEMFEEYWEATDGGESGYCRPCGFAEFPEHYNQSCDYNTNEEPEGLWGQCNEQASAAGTDGRVYCWVHYVWTHNRRDCAHECGREQDYDSFLDYFTGSGGDEDVPCRVCIGVLAFVAEIELLEEVAA